MDWILDTNKDNTQERDASPTDSILLVIPQSQNWAIRITDSRKSHFSQCWPAWTTPSAILVLLHRVCSCSSFCIVELLNSHSNCTPLSKLWLFPRCHSSKIERTETDLTSTELTNIFKSYALSKVDLLNGSYALPSYLATRFASAIPVWHPVMAWICDDNLYVHHPSHNRHSKRVVATHLVITTIKLARARMLWASMIDSKSFRDSKTSSATFG